MYSRNWKSRNGRRKNVATFHSKWNRWVSQSRGQKKKSLSSLSFVLTADRWARGPTPRKKISFSAPLPRLSGKLMIQTDTEIQFDLIPKFRVKVNSKMQVHRSSPQTSDRFKVVPVRICRNQSALSQTFMLLWSFDV